MPTKSNKANKRLSIFHFCAPLAPKITEHNELLYLCPICGNGYPEESALNGEELTLEHVPPQNMGGAPLILTCRECNSKAGDRIDFHIKNQKDLDSFTQIVTGENFDDNSKGTSANLIVNGENFRTKIQQKDQYTEIQIIGKANNPAKVNELKEFFVSGSENNSLDGFRLKIQKTIKLDRQLRKIALLKSGFLLLTTMLGYTYAFDERLSIVRKQILNPENNLLGSSFYVTLNGEPYLPKRCIIDVSDPLPMFLVIYDGEAVILPTPSSPTDLYTILKTKSTERIVGKVIEWPKKPLMVLDL